MYYSHRTLEKMLVSAGWTVEAIITIGLGIDEFVLRAQKPRSEQIRQAHTTQRTPSRRRIRHTFRDAFLALGLGENLAAIAYPSRPGRRLPAEAGAEGTIK
jgi:hypothetical protein